MFILNKKSGVITECNNADAIKTCKKDTNYEVEESIEAFNSQKSQEESKKIIIEENKISSEEPQKSVEGENEEATQEDELRTKTVADLRMIAKEKGIQGYMNMNKDTLVVMIMNH